jgi:hypothetical protein
VIIPSAPSIILYRNRHDSLIPKLFFFSRHISTAGKGVSVRSLAISNPIGNKKKRRASNFSFYCQLDLTSSPLSRQTPGAAMQLPRLRAFPPDVLPEDVGRVTEAMLAGLRSDPPDGFVDDWQESVEEAERLLGEVESQLPV